MLKSTAAMEVTWGRMETKHGYSNMPSEELFEFNGNHISSILFYVRI